MACNCTKRPPRVLYEHIAPGGKITTYTSETEAKMAVARLGGTWRKR